MKKILLLALLFSTMVVKAQPRFLNAPVRVTTHDQIVDDSRIGDETQLFIMKKGVKVVCSNDTISARLLRAFDGVLTRYTCTYKKDRNGRYKEYIYYLPDEVPIEQIKKVVN